MQRYIKSREIFFVLLLFFILTIVFFRTVIFSKGIIVGHDWMLPYNSHQMERYLEHPFFTWTYDMNLFGVKNPFFIQMPFMILTKIFIVLGLSGEMLSKSLVLLVFTFSGLSMYLLLKYLGLNKISSVLGGFILITMPVFFDYTVMGWMFVLFSVGIILPISLITFIRSIEENKIFFSVLTGLLFSVAILQSQSLVWFPMVFLALSISLIKDRTSFIRYIRSLTIVVLIALSLHASWLPNLFIYKDSGVINSDLALDSVSLGMRSRLSFVNILRGWGGLFNYHYEISYPGLLMPISFLIPLMALSSILIKIKNQKDIRFGMLVILVYMFMFYAIKPQLMSKIPFSNVIRDTGRFTALTSFAFAVLAGYFLNFIISLGNKHRIFFYGLIVLIIINAIPFFNGELYGEPQRGYDVRMRTYVFPNDYEMAENYLYNKITDSKVYYPPSGTNIGIKNNPNFFEDFREIKDPFRGYSPFPGTIYMYYSSMGKPSKISFLLDSVFDKKIDTDSLRLLGLMNIENIIIRDDIFYPEIQAKNIQSLLDEKSPTNVKSIGNVKIFANDYFLPHFYIPDNLIYSSNDISILPEAVSSTPDSNRPGVFAGNESDSLLRLADIILIKGSSIRFQVDEIPTDAGIREYEFTIPKDGEYHVYTDSNTAFNLSSVKSLTLKKSGSNGEKISMSIPVGGMVSESENGKYIIWGKVGLEKGKLTLILPYTQATDLSEDEKNTDLIMLKNISSDTSFSASLPKISFERINPTKYHVNVTGANSPFVLVFSESYHEGWKVFPQRSSADMGVPATSYFSGEIEESNHKMTFVDRNIFETWGNKSIGEEQHHLINGYANSWIIDPVNIGENDFDLIVEYSPQRNFILGLAVSTVIFSLCLVYFFFLGIKKYYLK